MMATDEHKAELQPENPLPLWCEKCGEFISAPVESEPA